MLAGFFDALVGALPFEVVELVAAVFVCFFVVSFFLMVPFGFLFRLGSRLADWLIRDLCDTYRMCKEMFPAFISWLWKKVRR